ncbi:MAG: hypothetical protein ACK5P7_12015 [Bdellovibrio sp.]|jgi:hypothetical protein
MFKLKPALTALVLTTLSTVALAQSTPGPYHSYKLQFSNDEQYTMNADLYTIVSHVDSGWDQERVSFAGSKRLVNFSKDKVITRFGFISSYGGGDQGFSQDEMTFVADSVAGSHKLSFSQPKGFYIAGGNLTLCLCEVLRDLIHGTEKASTAQTQNFFLVSDAIYDDVSYFPPELTRTSNGAKFNLLQLEQTTGLTDAILTDYIQTRVVGKRGLFCEGQNYFQHANINPANLTFELYRGARQIAKIGQKGRVIKLILAPAAQLDEVSKAFGLDKYYPVFEAP